MARTRLLSHASIASTSSRACVLHRDATREAVRFRSASHVRRSHVRSAWPWPPPPCPAHVAVASDHVGSRAEEGRVWVRRTHVRRGSAPFPHVVRTVGFGGNAPELRWEGAGGRTWTVGSALSDAHRFSAVRSGHGSCHVDGSHWLPRIRWDGESGRDRHVAFAPPLRSIDTVRATWQVHPTVAIDGFEGVVRNASPPTVETPITIDAWKRPSTFHVTKHPHQPVEDTTRSNDGERKEMPLPCTRDRKDGPGFVRAGFVRARWNGRRSDGQRCRSTSVEWNGKKRPWTRPVACKHEPVHRGAGWEVRNRNPRWQRSISECQVLFHAYLLR